MASAKIFRINYKSDFILTLTSDAGWMTPFCIKFWTGAPAQAYFVGWDGDTYDHCSFDPSEPTKLQVQFDDHHLPIGDLKYQVAYHFNVADFPNDTEDEVINAANIITEIDGETYQVMLDFTGETAPEIQFALPAYANEAQRIANEQQRIANETQRIANEETRIQHEQQRIAAEQIRQQNEQQRINQEQARVNEYATLKADAVAATGAANDAAALANQKAQLAADKAALAQAAADLANAKAQLAADKAALAASSAQLANDKAALAQQKAEYAQTQGDYAKDQGDYAKAQGDTALADHQRAEADHGIAVDDHTQAGNDHTRAESDHGIAVGDHTQAGNDHTRAESDHDIAVNDHTQAGTNHQTAAADHQTAAADHTQAGNDHTRAESDHTRAESDHAAVEVYVDSLGAFDISAYHATGGVLAKYADLTAALGTGGANIPDALRKGGMSVKFIQGTAQSSDSNYVQFRYMLQYENTTAGRDAFVNTKNWQGIDNEPLIDSDNLINSDSIARADFGIRGTINFKRVFNGGGITHSNSSIEIPLKKGVIYSIILNNESEIDNVIVYYINSDNTYTSVKSITKGEQTTITPPDDKKGLALYKASTGYKLVSISLTNPNSLKEYIESSDNVPTENSGKLIKSGAVYKELYGYNESYNFIHTAENGTFNFHIPAGNYTVSSNYADLYSGTPSLYFKDAEGNVIISDPITVFINNGLQLNQDVEKIELYGSVSTPGILSIIFASQEHTGGIKDDLNELQNDVSYLSSGLSLQKDILLNEEQVTVTGTGQYVYKTILTLEGNEIDNNCWYYFEADSFSGSQSTAPLDIYATINGVKTSVANSRVNPDALCFYNTNGNSITKLEFVLYPLSSGAVFNGVRIYKMVDAVPCNVLDNVVTSVVQKEALSRVIPSTTCRTIAHRGWNATAPKNMLSAVLEAKKNLCSIVENDVFNSKDEQLVMWHDTTLAYLGRVQDINGYILYLDPTLMGELTSEYGDELYYNITSPLYWLNPTTNELYTWNGSQYVASSVDIATLSIPDVSHLSVKSFNLADLKRFDFGIWKNVKYRGETIPTFEEWVSYCKCIGVDIYIDKKLSDTLMSSKIEEMVTIVRRHGMLRHATWAGFYPEVRTYDHKARCIILTAPTSQLVNNEDLLQALEDGGEYSIIFEPEITQLTAENAALALDKGFGLEAYYVEFFPYNTPKRTIFQNMINAINLGCQGLTMDYYTVEDAIYGKYLK